MVSFWGGVPIDLGVHWAATTVHPRRDEMVASDERLGFGAVV